MTIRSGFFNSVNGDRKYDAAWFALFFGSLIANGIFPNPSNNLQVVSNTNMTTVVKAGKGWINGYFLVNDSDYVLQHDLADGALKRIDRIVMRLDYVTRQIEIAIQKGTYATTPTAPVLQRDTDAYELALADVLINNGATAVTQANITDQRLNTQVCGIVAGVVQQLDTTTLFNQYQDFFDTWSVQQQQEFESWLATIQDILSGDVAGNLLNVINEHKDNDVAHNRYGTATGTNTLVVTLLPAPTSLVAGFTLRFKNTTANTSAVTLNVNGLGAKPVVKSGGTALSSGNLKAGGVYTVCYDGTNFILQGEGGEYGTAIASEVLSGKTIGTDAGLVNGTMINRGSKTFIPSTTTQSSGAGFYSSVTCDAITFTAGENLIAQSPNLVSCYTTYMSKFKEIQVGLGGTIRVKFDFCANGGYEGKAQVYKNGSAVGTLRSTFSGTFVTYSQDFSVVAGDLIQIYAMTANGGFASNVKNFGVYANQIGQCIVNI